MRDINTILRRADVVAHRLTVRAFNAWSAFNLRCALAVQRFVCSLPRMSDETLTRCCAFAGLFAVASVRLWS